jgi:hypothetical protein
LIRRMTNTSREEEPTDNVGTQVAPQQKRRNWATAKEETDNRVSRKGDYFGVLEPYDGKLSRTVLRGVGSRKAPRLPGEDSEKVTISI